MQRDLAFNVEDYGARHYDPVIGRWLIPDELGEIDYDYSPFNYVGCNPISRTDPDGRTWWDKVVGATYAIVDNTTSLNLRDTYSPTDNQDYNHGQDVGDVGSILIGIIETGTGNGVMGTAATATVTSAGTLIGATAPAAALGGAMVLHGISTTGRGIDNFASQKGRITEEKANNLKKSKELNIPDNQIGPSGNPKRHTVEKPTPKRANDAARNNQKSNSSPKKHTRDSGQKTHYHSARDGKKMKGKDNIHYTDRSSKKNPPKKNPKKK